LKPQDPTYGTDKELVKAILNADRQAFAVFVDRTENLVAKIVFQMTGGSADRKDLVQEIYIKAFRNLDGFRFASKLSTPAMILVSVRKCIIILRRRLALFYSLIPILTGRIIKLMPQSTISSCILRR